METVLDILNFAIYVFLNEKKSISMCALDLQLCGVPVLFYLNINKYQQDLISILTRFLSNKHALICGFRNHIQ